MAYTQTYDHGPLFMNYMTAFLLSLWLPIRPGTSRKGFEHRKNPAV